MRDGRDHLGATGLHVDGIDWRNPVRTGRPEAAGYVCRRLTYPIVEHQPGFGFCDNRAMPSAPENLADESPR